MSGPTRRRLLSGVSGGAILLSRTPWQDATAGRPDDGDGETGDGDGETGDGDGETDDGTTGALDVAIVETSESVGAGDYFELTVAVENAGTSDVRTEVDFLVGEDRERVGRVTTTIEAGETTTLSQGFYTYPALSEREFPIRVETSGAVAEGTGSVTGAELASVTRPDTDLAVQPGTDVLFEVGESDPDEPQTVVWWVDGEQVGGPVGGPWQATYATETGFDYWWHSFETTGTHEIAAAVIPYGAAETDVATWTVAVTADGPVAPAIESQRPPPGSLPSAPGETVTFELDVTASDGRLDRVVWWLTQADVILDVTELTGSVDTARLSVEADRLCHTCQVVPWVVGADGTVSSPEGNWQIGT